MKENSWVAGRAPVAVVMITLNEAHNMEGVLDNLQGWAQEVFVVDSYSQDDTVATALRYGSMVVQRRFAGFGDQWNFAMQHLPIASPWIMKLDPDERLNDTLKQQIVDLISENTVDGISVSRRLWFMGRKLPVREVLLRAWRTGRCRFTNIAVNEYPVVDGAIGHAAGELKHEDSPDLDHWLEKQNRYTTAEAVASYRDGRLADQPRLFGSGLQRRMWLKKHFYKVPGRYTLFFLYYLIIRGTWRAGWVGFAWARLRSDVMRLVDYKRREMAITGRLPTKRPYGPGQPDPRVTQYD